MKHPSGKEISGWKQLCVTHELPKMHESTVLPIVPPIDASEDSLLGLLSPNTSGPCECGLRGINVPDTMIYSRKNVADIADFNKTKEWLGGGASTGQEIVISRKVFQLFEDLKVKTMPVFIPIKILN